MLKPSLICAFLMMTASCVGGLQLNPVIIVPGFSSSVLEGKFDSSVEKCGYYHRGQTDWFEIFPNDAYMLLDPECYFDRVKLSFNDDNKCLEDPIGIEVRPKDYGGVTGIEFTLGGQKSFDIIGQTLRDNGYVNGVNLRGAPYDFRKFGNECNDKVEFQKFKSLIEETYDVNHSKQIRLICHSMVTRFLRLLLFVILSLILFLCLFQRVYLK